MKILYHHRTRGKGVEGVHIREMVGAFKDLGHEVVLVSPPGADPFSNNGTVTHYGERQKRDSLLARMWTWISAHMPEVLFEVLEIAYNFWAWFKIQKILAQEKIDFIYERYAFFGWAGAYLAQKHHLPIILEVNEISGIKRFRKQVLVNLANAIERKVLRRADTIVTVTHFLKQQIENSGIDPFKAHVLPNAVDVTFFDRGLKGTAVRSEYHLEDKLILGFVGLFAWWDNLAFLIENFADLAKVHRNLHLLMVGDPSNQKESVMKAIKDFGIENNVTITGIVDRAQMPEHIAAMDVCVIPHSNSFGSPVVLFEYMAMGKAVVAPKLESIETILTHDKNGILFKPLDGGELKKGILDLVKNESKRLNMGSEAYKTVMERHLWEHNAKKVLDMVHALKSCRIPILMYHDVCPDDFALSGVESKYWPYVLRISDFDAQMAYLAREGYHTISLDGYIDFTEGKKSLPPKPIIITFDDGQASNYSHAFPILKKYGLTAAFFLIAGRMDTAGMLSWAQIREMQMEGMSFGSHTLTHPIPAQLTDKELTYELAESKRLLEQRLGKRVRFLSSPTGYFNKAISRIAKETGYEAVCIGTFGINGADADLFSLKRMAVKRDYSLLTFQSLLDEGTRVYTHYQRTQYIRSVLRGLMGVKVYEGLRSRILYHTRTQDT